jgi:hypothetical protein
VDAGNGGSCLVGLLGVQRPPRQILVGVFSDFSGGGVRRHGQNLPETSNQRKDFLLLFSIIFLKISLDSPI